MDTRTAEVLNQRNIGQFAGLYDAVYVGRPSIWGNPFVIGRDGNRADCCAKYEAWILTQPQLLARLSELRGKDLICYCAPLQCHADLLLKLANTDDTEQFVQVVGTEARDNTQCLLINKDTFEPISRCSKCNLPSNAVYKGWTESTFSEKLEVWTV